MLKGLKKEFIVKRNMKTILLTSIIDGVILSILSYIAITDYNEFLIDLLQAIAENNAAYEFSWIMLPCFIIVTLVVNLGFFTVNDVTALEAAKKEIKEKKSKKDTKKAKKQNTK